MSPTRPTGRSNIVFASLTDVQEYFAHQRQSAEQRKRAYVDGAGDASGTRMTKKEREIMIAKADTEARIYDDCWAMIGCIDVNWAYHHAGRIPEDVCQVCGEEQPARPVYCEYKREFDNGDQPNVSVECDNAATFRVSYEVNHELGVLESGTLCCGQHLSAILEEYGAANVTPLKE